MNPRDGPKQGGPFRNASLTAISNSFRLEHQCGFAKIGRSPFLAVFCCCRPLLLLGYFFSFTTENSARADFRDWVRSRSPELSVTSLRHGTFFTTYAQDSIVAFRGRLLLLLFTSTGAAARGDTHGVRVGSPRGVDRVARPAVARAPVARSLPRGRRPPRARTGGRRVASSDAPRVRGPVERGSRPFGAAMRRTASRGRATATDRVAARGASPARPPRTIAIPANRRRPPLRFPKPRRGARTRRRAWTRASGRSRFPRSRLCS